MRPSQLLRQRVRPLVSDRRGSVSVLVALALPPLIVAMALGIDASDWAMQRVELQRVADLAAMAGAARYASTTDASAALTAAASVAAVNPVSGATVTPTFVSPASVSVTAQKTTGFLFAPSLIDSSTPPTLSATAVADASPRTSDKACVLALGGIGTGVTTADDITLSGSTSVTLVGCDLRSNASMKFNGHPDIDVAKIVASGTISPGNADLASCASGQSPCDAQSDDMQQVPDPFASKYGGALSTPPSGAMVVSSLPASPLAPGIYFVQGAVTLNGGATLSCTCGPGQGITIITTDGLTINGDATVNLAAPTTGPTAGLLFASAAAGTVKFAGTSDSTLDGAIYVPNGTVSMRGNSGSAACLVVVANTVTYTGTSDQTNSGCSTSYPDLPTVYDLPPIARLVQ